MHKEKEMNNSQVKPSVIQRLPFKTSRLFSVFILGLILVGSPASRLHAEQAKANDASAIVSVTVNINSASATELAEALVGVGLNKAEAIVEYRDKNGPFTDKNQLLNVNGIGEATLKKNSSVIMLK